MEKEMTLQEKIDMYKSLQKDYSKKASTLKKRAETLAESAKSYQKQADGYRHKVEAYNNISFKSGDLVVVSGTHTGEGDQEGTVIDFAGLYGVVEEPYYTVQAPGKKHFVSQRFLTLKA